MEAQTGGRPVQDPRGVRICINGRDAAAIDANHRLLVYGDGLFETLRLRDGRPLFWAQHWARLSRGAARLGLALPDPVSVEAAMQRLSPPGLAAARLLLGRAGGAHGYRPKADAGSDWVLRVGPYPSRRGGLRVLCCSVRVSRQPLLAGLKHCNRLEQVLAQQECARAGVDEGLMSDEAGEVICATSANLFLRIGAQWLTPDLSMAGVAGVCRAWLLSGPQGFTARVASLGAAELRAAEELFLCNALRGPEPVIELDGRPLEVGATTVRLAEAFAAVQAQRLGATGSTERCA